MNITFQIKQRIPPLATTNATQHGISLLPLLECHAVVHHLTLAVIHHARRLDLEPGLVQDLQKRLLRKHLQHLARRLDLGLRRVARARGRAPELLKVHLTARVA